MILANELRIGNYASAHGKEIIKCVGLDEHFFYYMFDSCIKSSYYLSDIESIPLTPEILEKAGFEETYADNAYKLPFNKYSLHSIVITLAKENIVTILDEYTGKEQTTVFADAICQYLHQLQNLYFALTGEELNVQL